MKPSETEAVLKRTRTLHEVERGRSYGPKPVSLNMKAILYNFTC